MLTVRQFLATILILAGITFNAVGQERLNSNSEQLMQNKACSLDMGALRDDSRENGGQTSESAVSRDQAWWLCFEIGCVYLFNQGTRSEKSVAV